MTQRTRRRVRRRAVPFPIMAVAGGLALVGIAAFALFAPRSGRGGETEVTGQPRLKVDREMINLGDVRLGQTVDASFLLTNVGDQPLQLAEEPYIEVVEGC